MTSYYDIIAGARPWQGVLDPSVMTDDLVCAGHELADAAKIGNWPAVMTVLDRQWQWLVVNQWRPGGKAWFTALHQAAWHGAPAQVAAELPPIFFIPLVPSIAPSNTGQGFQLQVM